MTPEQIDYWADIYHDEEYRRYMTFAQFIASPEKWQQRFESERPLLPQQRAVQRHIDDLEKIDETIVALEKMERDLEHLPRRNGAAIEPLKHHRLSRR